MGRTAHGGLAPSPRAAFKVPQILLGRELGRDLVGMAPPAKPPTPEERDPSRRQGKHLARSVVSWIDPAIPVAGGDAWDDAVDRMARGTRASRMSTATAPSAATAP
jgi:hypothetical protein